MDWKVGLPVLVGERVSWFRTPQSRPQTGIIRWIGNIPEIDSVWAIGLEMDDPLPSGGCTGLWKDRNLFECPPNRGLIVPIHQIRKLPPRSDSAAGSSRSHLRGCELDSCRAESLRAPKGGRKTREKPGKLHLEHIYSDSKFVDDDHLSRNDLNERKRTSGLLKKYDKSILRLKHNRFLKTKTQDEKASLKSKEKERLSLREFDYDLLSSRKFEDDLQLVRKSLDACSYFTVKHLFDTPEKADSSVDMNDIAGYFKEINEDEVTSDTYRKPIDECEKQLGGLLALDYHGASPAHPKEKKFFSFLKWFRKDKDNSNLKLNDSSVTSSPVLERKRNSSCESLDTIFSTQTVRSFAYIPPTQYHPSAPSSSLLGLDKEENSASANNLHPPREKKKKRKAPDPPSPFVRRITRENSLPTTLDRNLGDRNTHRTVHRRTVSESFKDKKAGAYCHVQGKKKAPPPPPPPKPLQTFLYPDLQKLNQTLHKKKNPAPPPPNQPKNDKTPKDPLAPKPKPPESTHPIDKNSSPKPSLSPLSSRPWYKRTQRDPGPVKLFIKRDLLKGFDNRKNTDPDHWMPEVGFPRRSLSAETTPTKFTIFPKLEKPDDRKKEDKRKSQISILTNISELDKEAAEILRKEQVQERKIMAQNDARYYSPTPAPNPPLDLHQRVPETASKNTPNTLHFPNPQIPQKDSTPTPHAVSNDSSPPHQKIKKTIHHPQIPPIDPTHTIQQNLNDATHTNADKNFPPFNVRNKELRYLNQPWVCTKCTLENPAWKVFCEICTSVKPHFLHNGSKTSYSKDNANNQPKQGTAEPSTHFQNPHPLENLPNKRRQFFTPQPDKSPTSQDGNRQHSPPNHSTGDQQESPTKTYQQDSSKNDGKHQPETPDTNGGYSPPTEQAPTPAPGNSHQDRIFGPIKQPLTTKHRGPPPVANKVLEAYVITQTTVLEDIIVRKPDKKPQTTQEPPRGATPSPLKHFHVPEMSAKSKAPRPIDLTPPDEQHRQHFEALASRLTRAEGLADFKATIKTMETNTAINTVAVNKLLKNLEAAINTGDQVDAARLAKELALLKIDCSVTRQEAVAAAPPSKITVDMYVEDKVSHQGPIQVTVSPSMTLLQLKRKVHEQLGIPVHVQRWILGKRLATDDTKTLESDGVKNESCPVFLYLITPDKYETENGSNNVDLTSNNRGTEEPHSDAKKQAIEPVIQNVNSTGNTSEPKTANSPSQNNDADQKKGNQSSQRPTSIFRLTSRDGENEVEKELKLISANSVKEKVEQLNKTFEENSRKEKLELNSSGSWKCLTCTYVNSAGRQICFACSAKRPDQKPRPEPPGASNCTAGAAHPSTPQAMTPRVNNDTKLPGPSKIHYDQLIKLQDADMVPNLEAFHCPICLMDYLPGEGIILKDCLHTFCRPCLINTVQYSDDAEVKCPYLDEKYSCTSVLQQREIKALVPQKIFDQHLAKSVKEAENKIGNAFHCKTPDCKGWCIFEDNVNEFLCPVCNLNNCLTCHAIHTGINCKEYQQKMRDASDTDADAKKTRDMLEEMVLKGEAMGCPKCQVILMKKWGCDWLRCSMCKTEICWVTRGFRWGPGGKGDTSSGCKCGVNGIKCHPKCNYCH